MAYFKELIEAARSTGELREGDVEYILGLWEASDECRDLAHGRERWKWWQKNAEDIAKERGELFRAGEAMREMIVGHAWDRDEVTAWDCAAQPIRDMIASFPAKP